MTTFRPDTSFPFLALARKLDVPYAYVLWVADAIERGNTDENGRVSRHIHATMRAEAIRRSIVQNGAVK